MIFVWIETFDGKALPISWEALGAGASLAQTWNLPLVALVFGANTAAVAGEAGQRGAVRVFTCDDASLADFRLEPYAALLTTLVRQHQPRVVLAGATIRGRELMAAAAADVEGGLLPDVTTLAGEAEGSLTATRPVYAGKVSSTVRLGAGATQFATLRGRAFTAAEIDSSRTAEVTPVEAVLSESAIPTRIEAFEVERGSVSLSDAAIIVSGGRGMDTNPKEPPAGTPNPKVWKAQDGFENTLKPLADLLHAAVGASRAAVDAGYIGYAHQVGQTGKNVAPDVYIAVGISGAIQHQAGMRASKLIIAINKDADAPIFKLARYGLVGDLYAIVPALAAELERRLKG
jgi:electron transfer flavoprotein alpha subunit